jgi:hypothetical protein
MFYVIDEMNGIAAQVGFTSRDFPFPLSRESRHFGNFSVSRDKRPGIPGN